MIYNYRGCFKLCRIFLRDFIYEIPQKNTVFLTFDDGPNPETTPYILDLLQKHQIQATFFCTGHQIKRYPQLFERIIAEGHSVGNHGYEHLDGWKTDKTTYFSNVLQANEIYPFKLYRPPYGRMTLAQYRQLSQLYKVVFWTFMTCDYAQNISVDLVLNKLTTLNTSGTVIVFHDSIKAASNMKLLLPLYLNKMLSQSVSFGKLENG